MGGGDYSAECDLVKTLPTGNDGGDTDAAASTQNKPTQIHGHDAKKVYHSFADQSRVRTDGLERKLHPISCRHGGP